MAIPLDPHLLRAILEDPADDVLRLVLSDWLEERGEADRAELIRVQIELSKLPTCLRADSIRMYPVTAPVWEPEAYLAQTQSLNVYVISSDPLPNKFMPPWRTNQPVGQLGRSLCHSLDVVADGKHYHFPSVYVREAIQRGIQQWDYYLTALPVLKDGLVVLYAVQERELGTLSNYHVWAGHDFPLYGLSNWFWKWERGFISSISCSCNVFVEHAEALFRNHPITQVALMDKQPGSYSNYSGCLWRFAHGEREGILPPILVDFFMGGKWTSTMQHARWYETEEEAVKELSNACVAFGRAKVGLGPLKGRS